MHANGIEYDVTLSGCRQTNGKASHVFLVNKRNYRRSHGDSVCGFCDRARPIRTRIKRDAPEKYRVECGANGNLAFELKAQIIIKISTRRTSSETIHCNIALYTSRLSPRSAKVAGSTVNDRQHGAVRNVRCTRTLRAAVPGH